MLNSKQLKHLRLLQDLTLQNVGDVLGVSKNYISMLENNKQIYSEDFHDRWVNAIYKLSSFNKEQQIEYIQNLKESVEKEVKEVKKK